MNVCDFCKRTFKSTRGLNYHLSTSKCAPLHEQSMASPTKKGSSPGEDALTAVFGFEMEEFPDSDPPEKRKQVHKETPRKLQRVSGKETTDEDGFCAIKPKKILEEELKNRPLVSVPRQHTGIRDEEVLFNTWQADNDSFGLNSDSDDNNEANLDQDGQDDGPLPPDDSSRSKFSKYCENAEKNFAPLDEDHQAGIRLLDLLKRKKAPLDTYDEIMRWHLLDKKELLPGQHLGSCEGYISRHVLIKKLKERYNMMDKFPYVKEIILPFSRAKVRIVLTDFKDCIESLLTDPRLTDDDFVFVDDDPLAPPLENPTYVAGAQTGKAYRQGYAKYVTKKGQMGVGLMWYVDGATTGQFENLEIIAVKVSLTCLSEPYRKKDHGWRTVGYIVQYSQAESRGKKIFADSKHIDSQAVAESLLKEEGEKAAQVKVSEQKAQDFHAQLEVILDSYVKVQATGMNWDLYYRAKVHKVELVFWTILVRCDTDEAELMCGKYRMRTGNVKSLCRSCTCPREDTDNPKACYPFKTVEMMEKLIEDKDVDGLKELSQQNIENAWYKVRFNPEDKRGIHGACPAEMLHAMLLGTFKYSKECFVTQVGLKSELLVQLNALSKVIGDLFARQSERDLPKTKFKKGISGGGKIMAKEYRGILLLLATILRSTAGQELLKKKPKFKDGKLLKDWLMMVELLLQWESYLCEPKMKLEHVRRMMRKNRFIMHIMKKVARRTKGMGLKLYKFHAIVHMALDIILYGVPMEHDTGSCESGHKITKVAAKLTQKRVSVFELQTATRLAEFFLIELGMEELSGRPLWEYFDGFHHPKAPNCPPTTNNSRHNDGDTDSEVDDDSESSDPDSFAQGAKLGSEEDDMGPTAPVVSTGGAKFCVSKGEDGKPVWKLKTKMKDKKNMSWNDDVLGCVSALHECVAEWMPQIHICTEHKRNAQIFRAHPNYRSGGVWRDWVLVDWGKPYGKLPCEIWGFVVLDNLPEVGELDPPLNFAGIDLKNGTYAVVEASTWSTKEDELHYSEIFVPFTKTVGKLDKDGCVVKRKFYLADVEAFVSPLCVIPDIGSLPRCKYFQVKPRSSWVGDFIDWLEAPHDDDELDSSDDEEVDDWDESKEDGSDAELEV